MREVVREVVRGCGESIVECSVRQRPAGLREGGQGRGQGGQTGNGTPNIDKCRGESNTSILHCSIHPLFYTALV